MKKDQIVVIIRKRTGRWYVKKDLSSKPEIIHDQLELKVLNDTFPGATSLRLNVNRETVICIRKRAENRDIFFVEDGIDFDKAHDFYKGSL